MAAVMVEGIMHRIFHQIPTQLLVFVPFAELCQLISHEIEHLARMGAHIQIQQAGLLEFLLVVAPHLVDDGVLAVYDFVMRQRQNKNVVVEIRHREHQRVAGMVSVIWMHGEILKGIVHPTEIPFIVEAETAILRRCRDLEVIRRIFRHEHNVRVGLLEIKIGIFEEPNAGIVDRCVGIAVFEDELGYGIVAQTVNMIVVDPEVQRGFHKRQDMRLGVIKQHGAPFRVPQIFVLRFIDKPAVKLMQTKEVRHKVQRHDVENDADVCLMAAVNQLHQAVWIAIS